MAYLHVGVGNLELGCWLLVGGPEMGRRKSATSVVPIHVLRSALSLLLPCDSEDSTSYSLTHCKEESPLRRALLHPACGPARRR